MQPLLLSQVTVLDKSFLFTDLVLERKTLIQKQGVFLEKSILKTKLKFTRICVFSCIRLFVSLWTVACQPPLSIGIFRQEHWSELPYPLSGDLPNPGVEPTSPVSPALQVDSLPSEPPGNLYQRWRLHSFLRLWTALQERIWGVFSVAATYPWSLPII